MTENEYEVTKEIFGKIAVADAMLLKALAAVHIAADACSDVHKAAAKHESSALNDGAYSLLQQIKAVEDQVTTLSMHSRTLYRSAQVGVQSFRPAQE